MSRLEWDEAKRERNIREHGIDFQDLYALFESETITSPDRRFDYDENRFHTFGFLDGRPAVVAHTEKGDVVRVISARYLTPQEERRMFGR